MACKAKNSTMVATISINPNKTKAMGAATISVNSKNTFRANARVSLQSGEASTVEGNKHTHTRTHTSK